MVYLSIVNFFVTRFYKRLKGVEHGEFFSSDEYIAHLELKIEDLVAIVTNRRVMIIRIKNLKVDSTLEYDGKNYIILASLMSFY